MNDVVNLAHNFMRIGKGDVDYALYKLLQQLIFERDTYAEPWGYDIENGRGFNTDQFCKDYVEAIKAVTEVTTAAKNSPDTTTKAERTLITPPRQRERRNDMTLSRYKATKLKDHDIIPMFTLTGDNLELNLRRLKDGDMSVADFINWLDREASSKHWDILNTIVETKAIKQDSPYWA